MISFRNCIVAIMILTGTIYPDKLFASSRLVQGIHPKPWKITEQQFLDQYGKDDSSRALIRFYFEKKRITKRSTSNLVIITGGFAVITGALIVATQNSRSDNLAAVFVAFLSTSLSVFLTFLFGVALIFMSRKYLFKLLNKHQSGKRLPRKIVDDPRYNKFLQQEKQHS